MVSILCFWQGADLESISIAELHAAKTSLTSASRSLKAGMTAAGTDALAQEPDMDPEMVAAASRGGCRYGGSDLSQQPRRNPGPSKHAKSKPRAAVLPSLRGLISLSVLGVTKPTVRVHRPTTPGCSQVTSQAPATTTSRSKKKVRAEMPFKSKISKVGANTSLR